MSSIPSGHHLAAILRSKGSRFDVTHRLTPTPGPNELLIEVESIAFNLVDYYQRDHGIFIEKYPAILGSDIAGTIISSGSSVTADFLKPGIRVAAFATAFYEKGNPDYGAFQKLVIVPSANAVPLPNGMKFNEASLLPMAIATAWAGYYRIGLARDTKYTAADKKGLLVWGGASSIGSAAVQVAKSMGFIVYVTASEKHHEYMKTLGASRVFDYKSEDVVGQLVTAAKEDGVTIQIGYDAVLGALDQCLEVLKELKGEGLAMLASAPRVPEDFQQVDGVEVKFATPPADVNERTEHFHFVFNVWLNQQLANGGIVPSPRVHVIEGGLKAVDKALDELKKGVSGEKLVLEI